MSIDTNTTVADIVKDNPLSSKVFYKHGIDFCCGGKIPLSDSCQKHDVDLVDVVFDLSILLADKDSSSAVKKFSTAKEVIDEILNKYHQPLYETLPILLELSTKVANVHGEAHPELKELKIICKQIEADLMQHMYKEEKILFPRIIELEDQQSFAANSMVANPIHQIELEHDQVADLLATIKRLTHNFTPPIDACNSYRGLFAMLKEFEFELYNHIHLENNVLHPMALELENKI